MNTTGCQSSATSLLGLQERQLTAAERDAALEVLTGAFARDPHFVWLLRGGSDPDAVRRRFLQLLMDDLANPECCVSLSANSKGAMIWYPAGAWPLSFRRQWAFFNGYRVLVGLRNALERSLKTLTMNRHHPKEPHLYLQTIGVEPDAQGSGCGRELLGMLFSIARETRVSVYLETANMANVEYYQGHGFIVTRQTQLSSLTLWSMQWLVDSRN